MIDDGWRINLNKTHQGTIMIWGKNMKKIWMRLDDVEMVIWIPIWCWYDMKKIRNNMKKIWKRYGSDTVMTRRRYMIWGRYDNNMKKIWKWYGSDTVMIRRRYGSVMEVCYGSVMKIIWWCCYEDSMKLLWYWSDNDLITTLIDSVC